MVVAADAEDTALATLEWPELQIPPDLMFLGGEALPLRFDELRALGLAGDSQDQFAAEHACMNAWFVYGTSKGFRFDKAAACARRLLQYELADGYEASGAASKIVSMRREIDVGLALVDLGLTACERDTDLPHRCWETSDLLPNRLALMIARDPSGEEALAALEELSDLAGSWHVDFDSVLNCLEEVSGAIRCHGPPSVCCTACGGI